MGYIIITVDRRVFVAVLSVIKYRRTESLYGSWSCGLCRLDLDPRSLYLWLFVVICGREEGEGGKEKETKGEREGEGVGGRGREGERGRETKGEREGEGGRERVGGREGRSEV